MIVSYQLYSSREFGPIARTLGMLEDLGCRNVEGYGGLFDRVDDVAALKAALQQHDLQMPSAHVGLDAIEQNPGAVIDAAEALGISRIFVPYLDESDRPATQDGWRALGQRLTEATKPLRDAGLATGWHNHDFEFAPLADGAFPIEVLLDSAPDLGFEFDVAWAARAGVDPGAWIKRLGNRIVAAHIKDIAPPGDALAEDGWADAGQGIMDWPDLLDRLAETGCNLFVVEHDNPSDDQRFAKNSLDFLSTYEGRS